MLARQKGLRRGWRLYADNDNDNHNDKKKKYGLVPGNIASFVKHKNMAVSHRRKQ